MASENFVDDIFPQPLLYALTIRSPVARGRLKTVECPRLSPSYAIITAKDIPGQNRLDDFDVPVLAEDTLSYIGEPVALLLGPEQAKLEEYAPQCKVVSEEEPPVFTGNIIHPEMILSKRTIVSGDMEQAFARAKTVVSGKYITDIQDHWYAEPMGAVAQPSGEVPPPGKTPSLLIHTATQWPFHVKRSVARVLQLSLENITVESTCIGIHMDGKIWYPSLVACHAALGTFIMKKPVKLILTREEDFLYTPKRTGSEIHIRSALGGNGELLGTEISVLVNFGARGVFTDEILDLSCLGSLGSYKFDTYSIQGSAIKTNLPPHGPCSGFGLPQGFFAIERHISRIADTLRLDPAEWRKNNCLGKGNCLAIGPSLKEHPPISQLFDTVASMGDYYRKWASYELLRQYRREKKETEKGEPLRGIGIAAAWQGSGFLHSGNDKGSYSVEVTLDKDGALEIKTSMVTSNNDYTHIWGKIASEILAIDISTVRVLSQNTEISPDSGPASLSRNITVITKLVENACLAIRKQRFRDPLPITVRRSCKPAKIPGWEGKTGGAAVPDIDKNSLAKLSWGVAAVEVEIDPITYTPAIRGTWLGVDGGKILSEPRARRCLKIAVIQALSWASREQVSYTGGSITAEQLNAYEIPGAADIPPVFIDFLRNDTVEPKGIGELPSGCVPAAYVQAVSQALDHPFEKIPLTAADVWKAGRLKDEEKVQ
jgi:CO/xanthine dehydrogenase Mo-binding subunit